MAWNSYPYFPTQDLTSLNCPLSPMPPFTWPKLSGNHCYMVPRGQCYLGWEGDIIFWSNWSQHPLRCMSSAGFHAKLEEWHCSCVCGWAPEQLSLYPECLHLPHENSPFSFLSKPSVCRGAPWSPEHSAIPSILPSSPLLLSKTTLPPVAPKGPVHITSHQQMLEVWQMDHQFNHQPTSKSYSGLSYNTLQCEFSNSRCFVLF